MEHWPSLTAGSSISRGLQLRLKAFSGALRGQTSLPVDPRVPKRVNESCNPDLALGTSADRIPEPVDICAEGLDMGGSHPGMEVSPELIGDLEKPLLPSPER